MSEFKGTPGPWEVVNGADIFTPLAARNGGGTAAHETDGWHIADCRMGETQTEDGAEQIPIREQEANARLIAAAPELLEALRVMLNEHERLHALFDLGDCQATVDARAAIAKATGGAT